MNQPSDTTTTEQNQPAQIFHPRFAAFYEWYARLGTERRLTDPLRRETVGQASGAVLEVGAGTGLNFPFYHPERVGQASVPITLTQASVSALPFAGAIFDSVVVTLVYCSVEDPLQGLLEIRRVLKPQGTLFLFEHVRSQSAWVA